MAYKRQHRAPASSCVKLPLKLIVTTFFFVPLSMNVNVDGKIYKSIQWISTNPRFIRGNAEQNCKDDEILEIRVKVASKMAVLCPTKVMVVDTMEHENPQDSLYENLWIIYDKDSFDNCKIPANDSRKLLTCDDPHSLKYKTIVFNLYSASNTQVAFAEEKYYYFLSTSDGSQLSLNDTKGGHCNDTNMKISMKFRLFVCKEQSSHPNCNQTDFPFGQLRCVSTKTTSTTTTSAPPVALPSTESSSVIATSTVQPSTPTTTLVCTPTTVTLTSTTTISLNNGTISCSKESSQVLSPAQHRIGSSDIDDKDTWLMIAVFFIVLCAVLVLVLAAIVCTRHGKHETCLSDLNKVDCCASKNQNRYEKHDIGKEEKGMAAENKCENKPQGHWNPAYRESVTVSPRTSQVISTDGNCENRGTINRAYSEEEKQNSEDVVNENTCEEIASQKLKQDSEDLVDENTNKKIAIQKLKHDKNGIEMGEMNGIKEKSLKNEINLQPWSYYRTNNTTPTTVRNGVRA